MTKAQYNDWVTNTYLTADSCKNSGVIDVIFNHNKTSVMVIDLIIMATRSQVIKNDNVREAIAIAFARLRGEKVPKITDASEYERVPYGTDYYTIIIKDGKMFTDNYAEMNDEYDRKCVDTNNYFHTKERAEEVLNKIKMLLRLERLHDMFCPDYKPSSRDYKYFVSYNLPEEKWLVNCTSFDNRPNVYFPSQEIARQVADILNQENN